MTVTNIAELKSLNVATVTGDEVALDRPAVHVLGYYSQGDRGGGWFEWDPNASATPDGGLYIATNGWTTGNGRWVRRLNGEVANVKMWGAMGNIQDGAEILSVVSAAHDDTTNIQNAINAVADGKTASGSLLPQELLIPAGWYKVTDTLVLNPFIKLRGETVRFSHIVMPYGINKDILHTLGANQAIAANDAGSHYDGVDRIEDISFEFALNTDDSSVFGWPAGVAQNQTNAAIVISQPEEGSTIRNVSTSSGGYGIRQLGDGGVDMVFRDVTFTDTAIAGICVEPTPGANINAAQISITGISGDHRRDESRSNACLVKFVNYAGPAYIEGINTEGLYGGGVIHHSYPASLSYDSGNLTLKNCYLNGSISYSSNDAPRVFLVLENSGIRTTAVTMENIHLAGCTNLIRDELSQRDVPPPDATSSALRQAVVRLPLSYESYNDGNTQDDGFTQSKWSRLVVGGQEIYSFVPTTTNAWYRIMTGIGKAFVSGRVTVTSFAESSEFSANVLSSSDTNAVELNVTRSVKANTWPFPPCVTKVRGGSYLDGSLNAYAFTDIYVDRALNLTGDYDLNRITIAVPVYDFPNVSEGGGLPTLLPPKVTTSSGAPTGCTLIQVVTKNLTR
jgi:hypothetical protein